MQVVVDSLATEYIRVGTGKPVLVLHGWGDSSKGWQEFGKLLGQGHELIIPDLPGFGGTDAPPETWELDDYADFVAAFVEKLHIKLFAVVAHSNGGAIAIRGLAKGAFKVERLVLLDSAGIRGQYRGRTKLARLVTKTGKVFTLPLPKRARKSLRRAVYRSVGSDMLVAERLQSIFKRIVTDDVQADAASLHIPALFLYGAEDLDTPLLYGRLLHSLMDESELEVIPDAGHFVHLDKPETVAQLIKEFLS